MLGYQDKTGVEQLIWLMKSYAKTASEDFVRLCGECGENRGPRPRLYVISDVSRCTVTHVARNKADDDSYQV